MKKTLMVMILLLFATIIFTPGVLADELNNETETLTNTTVLTETGVQSIPPEEGLRQLGLVLLDLYKAVAVMIIPHLALVALVVGAIVAILAAAIGIEKLLKVSLIGMAVIFLAVAIVYAGPALVAMAQGFGEKLLSIR